MTPRLLSLQYPAAPALLIWFLIWSGWNLSAAEPITRIGEIRAMAPEEASKGHPVLLEDATLTCYGETYKVVFVSDGSDSICLTVANDLHLHPVPPPGTRLRVKGVTGPGHYLPVISVERLEVLGPGTLPKPHRITGPELFHPSIDAQWVETRATVKGASFQYGAILDLEIDGWRVKGFVPTNVPPEMNLGNLLEQTYRIHAVAVTEFNDERQMTNRYFYIPTFHQLVADPPSSVPEAAPVLAVNHLLRADSDPRQKVRIQGVVTHSIPGTALFLRGSGGSLRVNTFDSGVREPGRIVEVAGYPALAPFRPSLNAVSITDLGSEAPPAPVEAAPAAPWGTARQNELVSVRGDLVGIVREQRQTVYQCRESGVVFEAILPNPAPELPIGAYLSMTGICSLETSHPLGIPYQSRFRLALRSPQDIAVLRTPSWWTSERIWWGLSATASLGVVVFGWAFMLHRQVAAQTAVIRDQLERETIHEERQRIAREWHDSIEQQLMGVVLLLDDSRAQLSRGQLPASGESFALARRMLEHCREESRASIQGLRSLTLERNGLTGALQELLPPLAEAAGMRFSLQVNGEPFPLGSREEHHLLRIAQEAVANAAHHAQAQSTEVRLDYNTAAAQMEIIDDGCGFDPQAALARSREGHFGLQGIAERAEKIRASHEIESTPGHGTRIIIKLARAASPRENGTHSSLA